MRTSSLISWASRLLLVSVVWCVAEPHLASAAPLPSCPPGGARLLITLDNESGAQQTVTFTGTLLSASCSGGTTTFTQTVTGAGTTGSFSVTGLASGVWKHEISVGSQHQVKKSLIVADDVTGSDNAISWVAFAVVLAVDRTDDVTAAPTPQCPSPSGTHTCTLRQALSTGSTATAPVLIQFDPAVFPAGVPTVVVLTDPDSLPIAGYRMAVDGTDPDGDPTFPGDPYNRLVMLPSSGASFVFSNQLASLTGLFIQRPTLAQGATPKDVIVFDGTNGHTEQNRVTNCKVDGGGNGLLSKSAAHDCIEGLNGAGSDWQSANVVENTEVTACPDKGVKATTGAHVMVRDSWIHHNIGGGIQATLSGNIEADRNIVEYNGYNATAQVFADANGLAANGADPRTPTIPSVLQTNGNIIRNNSARGLSVQELSRATIANDFSCGALNSGTDGQNGIAIFNNTGDAAFATVRGTTTVHNGRSGVTVTGASSADFGHTGMEGDNAFTADAMNRGLAGHNFDSSTLAGTLSATGNQWQHCYAHAAHPAATCDGPIGRDISGSVLVQPAQPHRADAGTLPVQITSVYPTKARAGDLVRIAGSGFDAVDAYRVGRDCTSSIQQNNRCTGRIKGNCVQYEASPGLWAALAVQSVTPTEIAVTMPPTFSCSQPLRVRVQRLDRTGSVVAGYGMLCTNS